MKSGRTIDSFRRQNLDGVLDVIYGALYGSRDTEPKPLKHERRRR